MSATSFGLQRQTFRAREQNAKMKIAHKTYTQYVMLRKTGARLKRHVSAITEVLAFLRCMARGVPGAQEPSHSGPPAEMLAPLAAAGTSWNLIWRIPYITPPILLVVLTL